MNHPKNTVKDPGTDRSDDAPKTLRSHKWDGGNYLSGWPQQRSQAAKPSTGAEHQSVRAPEPSTRAAQPEPMCTRDGGRVGSQRPTELGVGHHGSQAASPHVLVLLEQDLPRPQDDLHHHEGLQVHPRGWRGQAGQPNPDLYLGQQRPDLGEARHTPQQPPVQHSLHRPQHPDHHEAQGDKRQTKGAADGRLAGGNSPHPGQHPGVDRRGRIDIEGDQYHHHGAGGAEQQELLLQDDGMDDKDLQSNAVMEIATLEGVSDLPLHRRGRSLFLGDHQPSSRARGECGANCAGYSGHPRAGGGKKEESS